MLSGLNADLRREQIALGLLDRSVGNHVQALFKSSSSLNRISICACGLDAVDGQVCIDFQVSVFGNQTRFAQNDRIARLIADHDVVGGVQLSIVRNQRSSGRVVDVLARRNKQIVDVRDSGECRCVVFDQNRLRGVNRDAAKLNVCRSGTSGGGSVDSNLDLVGGEGCSVRNGDGLIGRGGQQDVAVG